MQTGGDLDGLKKIRVFNPDCTNKLCDWVELRKPSLRSGRWYATNQILPNGTIIIVGGRASPSVEFYPPSPTHSFRLFPFLASVLDAQLDNLYPFVHLLPNGNLFIFANSRSVMYDPETGNVIKDYPVLPGGPRNYPSGGSSVMLPLTPSTGYTTSEVLVCGGAQFGVYLHRDVEALAGMSCGRMVVTDPDPVWVTEDMPIPRIMGDMIVLPTGEVLVINGAQMGSQGFERASNPALNPVLYRPDQPIGLRFMVLTPTNVARMYHSTANLLPDGRVLVAGSNPHYFYKFDAKFPTELRLEAFSPEYLGPDKANIRPVIEAGPERVTYGQDFEIQVGVSLPVVGIIEVNLVNAPFVTHSFAQGQRMVKLAVGPAMVMEGTGDGFNKYRIGCRAPPDAIVAPPGYYMAFAVNQGVPGVAKWIQLVNSAFY